VVYKTPRDSGFFNGKNMKNKRAYTIINTAGIAKPTKVTRTDLVTQPSGEKITITKNSDTLTISSPVKEIYD